MTGAVTYTLPPLRVAPTAAGDNDLDHGATTAVAILSDGLNRLRNVAIDRVMI